MLTFTHSKLPTVGGGGVDTCHFASNNFNSIHFSYTKNYYKPWKSEQTNKIKLGPTPKSFSFYFYLRLRYFCVRLLSIIEANIAEYADKIELTKSKTTIFFSHLLFTFANVKYCQFWYIFKKDITFWKEHFRYASGKL